VTLSCSATITGLSPTAANVFRDARAILRIFRLAVADQRLRRDLAQRHRTAASEPMSRRDREPQLVACEHLKLEAAPLARARRDRERDVQSAVGADRRAFPRSSSRAASRATPGESASSLRNAARKDRRGERRCVADVQFAV